MRAVLITVILAGVLAACTVDQEPRVDKHPLWKTQLDALEKAKALQGEVDAAAERRRQQIEDVTR